MKRLILFSSVTLFLATVFISDNPPGWYQQTLPVSDLINDIFFLDSLTGWVVTQGGNNDTSRIMKTTNGGVNWTIQNDSMFNIAVIQFVDANTGYAAGGNGRAKFLKTTNGGNLWITTTPFGPGISDVKDIFYISCDTGWFCSDDLFGGGIYKTTNGGISWQTQMGASFSIIKLFFINKDTGWAGSSEANGRLFRTTNGGTNWNMQFTFLTNFGDIFFINRDTGFIAGNFVPNAIRITTNGGFNWDSTSNSQGAVDIFFVNNITGYACANFSMLQKTTNGGRNWFRQTIPAPSGFNSIHFVDSLKGWAGGTKLIHTSDGGGPPIGIIYANSEVHEYKLNQNFPNPFNPTTIIFFHLYEKSAVELKVYNILGEEAAELIDDEHYTAGVYQFTFDASEENLPSGVYFYRLIAKSETSDKLFIDTKKMILIK